jgi:hypothetical protein
MVIFHSYVSLPECNSQLCEIASQLTDHFDLVIPTKCLRERHYFQG